MHCSFTSHIELLNAWPVSTVGEVFNDALAKCRAPFGLVNNEVFIAKSLPFDHLPVAQRMAKRERHKQALAPQRHGIAIGRLAGIRHEGDIKAPSSNQRNVLR